MKMQKLLQTLPIIASSVASDSEVTSIVYDSREVEQGSIFVAVKGFSVDGHEYIDTALSNGAVAILSEEPQREGISWIQVADIRKSMADFSRVLYAVSTEKMVTVAITGTNGKTTIASLFQQLFHGFYPANSCWQIGTTGNFLGDHFERAQRTTPEAVDLLRWIGEAKVAPQCLTLEASSHALVLKRLEGFFFDIAVFTNLTQDHLDFHETMENYYGAKKLLFTEHLAKGGIGIINGDDSFGKRLLNDVSHLNTISYGFGKECDVRIADVHQSSTGTFFRIHYRGKKYKIQSPLIGTFNVLNLTSVVAGALFLDLDISVVLKRIAQMHGVDGRMEVVELSAPFTVVVDYAHTPDALKNVLLTAKKITKGQVICVFGAGGDRDTSKRAIMAEVVSKNADYAYITSDNPRSENPESILEMVEQGMPLDFPYEVTVNRERAIEMALSRADHGDIVLIAGKGHETYQEIMGVKHHFDDREEVVKAWKKQGVTRD